jgi:protein associated with RNAse G/E
LIRAHEYGFPRTNITNKIIVQTYKYDGSKHRRWSASIQRQEGSLLVLDARFDKEIIHDLIGTIASGTISTEYYWLDRWFNVFRFAAPDGRLQRYYCNINVPPVFDGEILTYIDLDIDLLVQPDLSYRVLDREDFESNATLFSYSNELRQNVDRALNGVIVLIESREFPFNE